MKTKAPREAFITPHFEIRKSRHSSRLQDLRLRRSVSPSQILRQPLAPVSVRLAAEQKLHRLYLASSRSCRSGRCSRTPITSLFITLRYSEHGSIHSYNGTWQLQCDAQELQLGLCGNPVVHHLSEKLHAAIRESRLLHTGDRCLGIHIAWTFESPNGVDTHANTLLVNARSHQAWLFEPQGRIRNGFRLVAIDALENQIHTTLREALRGSGYQYRNYLTESCNFQNDNLELCYLWTTWIELLVVLNPSLTPTKLAEYLRYRYRRLSEPGQSRREMITMFAHYLAGLVAKG